LRLFAHHAYRLTKAETTGSVFGRVLRTMDRSPRVQFLLADFASATTGVKRALKRFPALAPFERRARHPAGLDLVHLVNLDARFREHAPGLPAAGLDAASLADLANGIPRSFPVHGAVFYFPDVPWADVREDDPVVAPASWYAGPPLPASPVPGILLTSHWWSTRRKIELHATVPLATPAPDARELPGATEPVSRKLRELGSFRAPQLRVVLERGEGLTPADSKHLEEIVRSWDAAIATLLDVLPLPHALPPPTPWMSSGPGPTSPYKAPLVSTFRPRGWRYRSSESGPGYLAIGKQSLRGNKLRAYFDVGSTSHSCGSFVALEGLGWRAAFQIAFVRGQGGPSAAGGPAPQYPIADDATWGRIVENVAVVIEHLERTSIAEAEALSPPAPAWFAGTD
jgi:hypothetical protein